MNRATSILILISAALLTMSGGVRAQQANMTFFVTSASSGKGADLGGRADRLIVDLNFLYHPSCRYNDTWMCPLAPPGNTISARISAGERLAG